MTNARSGGVVLVITHWFDPTADCVVEELNRRGAVVLRFDVADFPLRLTVTGRFLAGRWLGTLQLGERTAGLGEIRGAYFRRPTIFDFGPMDNTEEAWARAEARAGLGGLLMASDHWLNHPHRAGYADYRPVQLAVAARSGLEVPATLITNEPADARDFIEKVGEAIYKPMTHTRPSEGRVLYASLVRPEDLTMNIAASIAGTAHLFQERIKHEYAVRLTVVDDQLFGTAIHAHSEAAALDWRSDYDALSYEPVTVPEQVRHGIAAFMSTLRLRFGAFDFLVSPDRGWVFLEVNPNGQWAWIEEATGQPIAGAIADALTKDKKVS